MPIRCHRIPNVHFTRNKSHQPRSLQALAQVAATEPHRLFAATLSPLVHTDYPSPASFKMKTDILPVSPRKLGRIHIQQSEKALVDSWDIEFEPGRDSEGLRRAAKELATTDTPVAFPTETVYGLGADATRSSAVRAIFAAKGRPADNPLIVHIHSIQQLRSLLSGGNSATHDSDLIPDIYKPLIRKFWPGPLTIILPNPEKSLLASEVTAGLNTFGARMPRSILALALIRLANVPIAAPSANTSTRPSPTAAEHVNDDLNGRIRTIIDGGPCEVGVESTVVDGLSFPPTILRPGGVTAEQLRQCPGWESVVVGYKDAHEREIKPRAPGMKYRHYSPRATVILYEAGTETPSSQDILKNTAGGRSIGIIRTMTWPTALGLAVEKRSSSVQLTGAALKSFPPGLQLNSDIMNAQAQRSNFLRSIIQHEVPHVELFNLAPNLSLPIEVWDVHLGAETEGVARGLFSALRELDKKGADVIFVEGIDDKTGDNIAAAVMNRLRKAAEIRI